MVLTTSIVGFDSAWTDNPKAPGAVCVVRLDEQGQTRLVPPQLASFSQATEIIRQEQTISSRVLVALDQPTIVNNLTGSRPVERVVASYISWIGGGVQPSNRSKIGMFDDSAPIWAFKAALGAVEDPEASRTAESGLFILEVFPALALPGFHDGFSMRLGGPRYNPGRRKTFKLQHWQDVVAVSARRAVFYQVPELADWINDHAGNPGPSKADQDRLDAAICALIGMHWLCGPRDQSVMIGDRDNGYIVAPVLNGVHEKLVLAARKHGVPVDGVVA